jgi:hypothetical protein
MRKAGGEVVVRPVEGFPEIESCIRGRTAEVLSAISRHERSARSVASGSEVFQPWDCRRF